MDTIELKKIITSLLAEHADNNSTVVMSSIQADRPRTAIHQAHNAYGYSHSFSQKCLRVIYTHTQTYASSTISPSAATYQSSALLLKTPALLAHVRFPHTHTTTCCAPPLFMKMYLRSSTSNPIHLEHSAFHHTPILPSIKWMASTQTFL